MSFRRSLLGDRSQAPRCSATERAFPNYFQQLAENDVCEFESSEPSHAVGSLECGDSFLLKVQAHILVRFLAFVLWKSLEMWEQCAGLGNSLRTQRSKNSRVFNPTTSSCPLQPGRDPAPLHHPSRCRSTRAPRSARHCATHASERTRSAPSQLSAPDHPRTKANPTPLLSVAAILNTKRLAEKANPRILRHQAGLHAKLGAATVPPPRTPGRHGTKSTMRTAVSSLGLSRGLVGGSA